LKDKPIELIFDLIHRADEWVLDDDIAKVFFDVADARLSEKNFRDGWINLISIAGAPVPGTYHEKLLKKFYPTFVADALLVSDIAHMTLLHQLFLHFSGYDKIHQL
jgi:hypothetical protein